MVHEVSSSLHPCEEKEIRMSGIKSSFAYIYKYQLDLKIANNRIANFDKSKMIFYAIFSFRWPKSAKIKSIENERRIQRLIRNSTAKIFIANGDCTSYIYFLSCTFRAR